jgi:hypothetical protein
VIPKTDSTYVLEFRMADGEALAISVETRVLEHFQSGCLVGCLCRTFRKEPLARL